MELRRITAPGDPPKSDGALGDVVRDLGRLIGVVGTDCDGRVLVVELNEVLLLLLSSVLGSAVGANIGVCSRASDSGRVEASGSGSLSTSRRKAFWMMCFFLYIRRGER